MFGKLVCLKFRNLSLGRSSIFFQTETKKIYDFDFFFKLFFLGMYLQLSERKVLNTKISILDQILLEILSLLFSIH